MKLTGLISATYTPFKPESGEVNLDLIAPMTEFMLSSGSAGFYVCGSTGEGESLSVEERKSVAAAFVTAANGRAPVIVQAGHNSVTSSKELAAHAAAIGADAISTLPPTYFKPGTPEALIEFIESVTSAAPNLPYYYYHIPNMSGVRFDMIKLLQLAAERVPSFNGVKFSDYYLADLLAGQEFEGERYDILFGSDEMMLGALACGTRGMVGSSYGFAAPLWTKIIESHNAGEQDTAHRWMRKAARLVRLLATAPGPYPACAKQVIWPLLGFEPGPLRTPQPRMSPAQITEALRQLKESEFAEEIATGEYKLS